MATLCGEEELSQLIGSVQAGTGDGLAFAERLIDAYPEDARLHFLRGSLLAGSGRAIEAHLSLARAVELAPDFTLARFQLGFFELTSGEAARALRTWEPLSRLPDDGYLSRFVTGLTHLIHDRFAETVDALRSGIALNNDNPALNADMQLIIDQCRSLIAEAEPSTGEASATSFLLGQLGGRGTTH